MGKIPLHLRLNRIRFYWLGKHPHGRISSPKKKRKVSLLEYVRKITLNPKREHVNILVVGKALCSESVPEAKILVKRRFEQIQIYWSGKHYIQNRFQKERYWLGVDLNRFRFIDRESIIFRIASRRKDIG